VSVSELGSMPSRFTIRLMFLDTDSVVIGMSLAAALVERPWAMRRNNGIWPLVRLTREGFLPPGCGLSRLPSRELRQACAGGEVTCCLMRETRPREHD